jgi:hypothetical protein
MPIRPPGINAINPLFFVPAGSPWQGRLAAALARTGAGADRKKIARHLALLERRQAGLLDWEAELGDEGARPFSATRAYSAMLKAEDRLPLYRFEDLVFTADLFNPDDEGGDPAFDPNLVVVELLIHRDWLYPWPTGRLHDGTAIDYANPEHYARLAFYGAELGELVALWAEELAPLFACADVQNSARFIHTATDPASVRNPAPPGTRHWDYLWPLSYWSPALLDENAGLAERLRGLSLTPAQQAALDRFEARGVAPT